MTFWRERGQLGFQCDPFLIGQRPIILIARRCNGGIFLDGWQERDDHTRSYAGEMTRKYAKYFRDMEYRQVFSMVFNKALNIAAAEYFGLPNFSRASYQAFEKQISDALMREPTISHIKARAFAYVLKWYPQYLRGHAEIAERLGVDVGVGHEKAA